MSRKWIWTFGSVFLIGIFLLFAGASAEQFGTGIIENQTETTDDGTDAVTTTPVPPPSPTPVDPAATPVTPADAPAVGDTDTDVVVEKIDPDKLEAYEQNLDQLRERIFKSKSRLMQLYEQLRLGSVSIVGISVLHTHEVGSTFKLESITYTLDGFEVYAALNDQENSLEKLTDASVFTGSLLPGDHLIVVDMVFRGKGYGVFSYLNQYLFKVKSRYSFNVIEGDVVTLKVTSYDEGSFLTPLKKRLRVRFEKE